MEFRDNLLVTAGARAAYMHDRGDIELPSGVEGEEIVAEFVTHIVNQYMSKQFVYGNFDNYIEIALTKQYGVIKKPTANEAFSINANSINALKHSLRSMILNQEDSKLKDINYALYRCVLNFEEMILELDRRTR